MDERAVRVGGNGTAGVQQVRSLEQDIEHIRARLGGLVNELGRRRHDAMDLRLQVRRHPFALSGLAVLVAGGITMLVVSRIRRRRRMRLARTRFRRLRHALAEAIDTGQRTEVVHHREELSSSGKLVKALGAVVAGHFGKQLGRRIREGLRG